MSYKKVTLVPMLVLILLLGASGVAQADPPVPGEDPPDGSSLNETLSFNNLGTIMSGRNDAGEADDGVDDQDPGDEVDDPDGDLKQHPVASALAEFFGVTYEKVMELHEAGNGFGTITKAFFFADKFDPPLTPEQLLEKAHGTGWGNVLKEGNIHPGSVGNGGVNSNRPDHAGRPDKDGPPGQVKKNDEADGVSPGTSDLVGPGNNGNNGRNNGNSNNNGNGNNKGVNGRSDDNEGGPGNNGNNGNNGRGNGNGRGRGNK